MQARKNRRQDLDPVEAERQARFRFGSIVRTSAECRDAKGVSSIVAVNPDANIYVVALVLILASAFLFGAVPVRQVLRIDPYEIVKSGSIIRIGRRVTVRDALLVVQIAI